MPRRGARVTIVPERRSGMATVLQTSPRIGFRRFEYRVLDTGRNVEAELNALGAEGWQVVGVTTKKQLLIAPPQAIILMREVEPA
jgi:hypothetical protein